MWNPRTQNDRGLFAETWRRLLEGTHRSISAGHGDRHPRGEWLGDAASNGHVRPFRAGPWCLPAARS